MRTCSIRIIKLFLLTHILSVYSLANFKQKVENRDTFVRSLCAALTSSDTAGIIRIVVHIAALVTGTRTPPIGHDTSDVTVACKTPF
jgi:hypothetical protein